MVRFNEKGIPDTESILTGKNAYVEGGNAITRSKLDEVRLQNGIGSNPTFQNGEGEHQRLLPQDVMAANFEYITLDGSATGKDAVSLNRRGIIDKKLRDSSKKDPGREVFPDIGVVPMLVDPHARELVRAGHGLGAHDEELSVHDSKADTEDLPSELSQAEQEANHHHSPQTSNADTFTDSGSVVVSSTHSEPAVASTESNVEGAHLASVSESPSRNINTTSTTSINRLSITPSPGLESLVNSARSISSFSQRQKKQNGVTTDTPISAKSEKSRIIADKKPATPVKPEIKAKKDPNNFWEKNTGVRRMANMTDYFRDGTSDNISNMMKKKSTLEETAGRDYKGEDFFRQITADYRLRESEGKKAEVDSKLESINHQISQISMLEKILGSADGGSDESPGPFGTRVNIKGKPKARNKNKR